MNLSCLLFLSNIPQPNTGTMGTAHAKLAPAGMVEAHIPRTSNAGDMRTPNRFSAFSAVLSNRLFRRGGAQNKAQFSTTPSASPDGFLLVKDDRAAARGDRCGESCDLEQRLKQDRRMLIELFESAKQAGAIKDTSNEDYAVPHPRCTLSRSV